MTGASAARSSARAVAASTASTSTSAARAQTTAARSGWSLALVLAASACTSIADRSMGIDERARSLETAERAFADAARTEGVKAAFLAALADDATLFRPGPVAGKAYTAERPDPPIRLAWSPSRVAVSASGDLGYSTGPFRLTTDGADGRSQSGQFFTVWRRASSGRWEVLIDLGVSHPDGPASGSTEHLAAASIGVTSESLDAAEARFATATDRSGPIDAYRRFASPQVRLLRDGLQPLDGPDAVDRLPGPMLRWSWQATSQGTAHADDLGWTMGRYRAVAPSGPDDAGFFVRVWRVEAGQWKILADILAPIPSPIPTPPAVR